MDKLNIATSIMTLALIAFAVVKGYFSDNKKQDEDMVQMKASCELKHKAIDQNIDETKRVLVLIQENDLKHIEHRVGEIEKDLIKIETILEERLPFKQSEE